MRVQKMPTLPNLPPLPELGPAEENMMTVQERFSQADRLIRDGTRDEASLRDHNKTLVRSVTGANGWSATLYGLNSQHLQMVPKVAYALENLLKPLGDWWMEAIENTVAHCPEPDEAVRQSTTITGRKRLRNTVMRLYNEAGDLILPSGHEDELQMVSTLSFDGKAPDKEVIWPFNIDAVTGILLDGLEKALNSPGFRSRPYWEQTGWEQTGWRRFGTVHRRRNRNLRLYEDFSGTTPEERQVYTKHPPAPLKPSTIWTTGSHRISTKMCDGGNCSYEPKGSATGRKPSGCDLAWKEHARAIFEEFRKANPEIQYKNAHPCPVELEKNHPQSYCRHNRGSRNQPLDHDEICRFPDGEKLIISHPYADEDETFPIKMAEWHELVPGLRAANGGKSRSWYFPGSSTLLIIAKTDVLERVNLDFIAPTDSAPTGCRRWR